MSELLTQITSIYLDGTRLPAKEVEYLPSKSPKEAVPGLAADEILGYIAKEPEPAKVDVTIAHTDGLSVAAYKNITDSTITMVTSGGKTYTMQNAFYFDHQALTKSEWKLTFAAKKDAEASGTTDNTGGGGLV